jgi:hypothetical protein
MVSKKTPHLILRSGVSIFQSFLTLNLKPCLPSVAQKAKDGTVNLSFIMATSWFGLRGHIYRLDINKL